MPPLMGNHGNYVGSLGNVCRCSPPGGGIGRSNLSGLCGRRGAARFQRRGRRRGHRRHGHRQGWPSQGFLHPAAWSCAPSTRCSPEGARGSLAKTLIERFGLDAGREAAEIRARSQGALGDRAATAPARPGAAQLRLAARRRHRRRLVPLSFRRPPGVGRICRASRLPQPSAFAIRRVSALQDPPAGARAPSRAANAWPMGRAPSTRAATSGSEADVFRAAPWIGCAAGFVNVPRIKGSHNAMLSGMLAAEHIGHALEIRTPQWTSSRATSRLGAPPTSAGSLAGAQRQAALVALRHARGAFALGGLDMWSSTLGFSALGTLRHASTDWRGLQPAAQSTPIPYPQARRQPHFRPAVLGILSNTNHEERPRGAPADRRSGPAVRIRARYLWWAIGALLSGRSLRMGRGGGPIRAS